MLRALRLSAVIPAFRSRLYSTSSNSSLSPTSSPGGDDYQAPSGGHTQTDPNYPLFVILGGITLCVLYDTLFVRRNRYANRRTFKLVSRGVEGWLERRMMLRMITDPYSRYLCKQSVPECQRVVRVLDKVLKCNKMEEKKVRVQFYDLPNMFIHLGADNVLYVSVKTTILAQTDDELAFLICHELAHSLLDHHATRMARLKLNQISTELSRVQPIQVSEVNTFENLSELNEMVCYYPSYVLLDKFVERDTDVLAQSLFRSCPDYDLAKIVPFLERLKEYMKDYPLRLRRVSDISARYIYDRVEMNKIIIQRKDTVKPFAEYAKGQQDETKRPANNSAHP